MDSFEWNKIIGAVLGTAIFIFVVRVVAEPPHWTPRGTVRIPPALRPYLGGAEEIG